ncbi:hypothetical protein A3Q56_01641 [Intoshia linei]|uniref:Uncharacterized protein n=1 Tax=Intoshia linei TaxID=1819745 RepID=A0A177BAZ8_9BILA|nr:hypothetical protein A3Q56_01641 [Intoshia linei]
MEIQFQSSNNLNQTVNQNQMGQMYQNQMLPNSQFNQLNYHNASSDNLMYSSVGNFMYNQQPTIPSQINNSYSQINNILNSEGGSFKNNYNRYPPGRVHITYSNQNANPGNAKILLQKPTQNLFLNENVMFVPPPKKQDKIFHSDNYTRYIDKIITNNSGYSTLKAPQQNQDIDIPQRLPLDWFDNVNPTIDKRKMTKYLWDVRDALIQSLL